MASVVGRVARVVAAPVVAGRVVGRVVGTGTSVGGVWFWWLHAAGMPTSSVRSVTRSMVCTV